MGLKFIILAVLITAAQSSSTLRVKRGGGGNSKADDDTRSKIEAERKLAQDTDRQALISVYDVLKAEYAKRANRSANHHSYGPILPPGAENATFEIMKVEIDSFLNGTKLADPSTSAAVEKARPQLYALLLEKVKSIYYGIELINTKYCAKVQSQVEQSENRTIEVGAELLGAVFDLILDGRDPSSLVGAAILGARRCAISRGSAVTTNTYNGIRIVLTKVCPNIRFPGLKGLTLQSLEDGGLAALRELIDLVFDAILIVFDSISRY